MPGAFPDYPAPVVRNSGGELEMTMMRTVDDAEQSDDRGLVRRDAVEIADVDGPHLSGW
jgi:hypothetical protein